MDIQSIFYFLGSLFLILGIVIMVLVIFILIKIYQGAKKTQENIEQMKNDAVEKVVGFVSSRPTQVASILGMGLSTYMIKKIKSMFQK